VRSENKEKNGVKKGEILKRRKENITNLLAHFKDLKLELEAAKKEKSKITKEKAEKQ
jgi:hypothetical protein